MMQAVGTHQIRTALRYHRKALAIGVFFVYSEFIAHIDNVSNVPFIRLGVYETHDRTLAKCACIFTRTQHTFVTAAHQQLRMEERDRLMILHRLLRHLI